MIYPTRVPNEIRPGSKILIVGEAPGQDEVRELKPFVGASGSFLTDVLMRNGISRDEVSLANLCQYRPEGNDFTKLFDSKELDEGIKELNNTIIELRPNLIIALGNASLYYLTGKGKKNKESITGIGDWRGSILSAIFNDKLKVIPTYHPSYIIRDRSKYPIFDSDIKRCVEESNNPKLNLPEYTIIINPKGDVLHSCIHEIIHNELVSIDIESVIGSTHVLCVGFGVSEHRAIVFVNDGSSDYSYAVSTILESKVNKIGHNAGAFDKPMLEANGFKVVNYIGDTMLLQHVMYPELPRSLAYLTSIYTRQPYYKDDGDEKSWGNKQDRNELYIYNGKDCVVTYKIYKTMMLELASDSDWTRIYDYEMSMLNVANSISQNGFQIDKSRRQLFSESIQKRWDELQLGLNMSIGEVVNVKSVKLQKLLYETLELPVRKNAGKVTADEDAIVSLIGYCKEQFNQAKKDETRDKWKYRELFLRIILEIRGLRTLKSNYIDCDISADGRIRSSYKVSSTETGRWAATKYIDKTGCNAQTFSRGSIEVGDYEKSVS